MPAQSRMMTSDGTVSGDPGHDGAVIARSLRDPEQFAIVFRRHAAHIHRYVVRRIGVTAAEDVVAETFLVAFRQRSAFHPDRPDARPWLYGIATNLIGHHRRAEVRQYRALARTGIDPVTEPFTDRVEAMVTASAESRRLAAALAKLPAESRDALLLVAWGELTYEQAALALDVPVGTLRSRLSRARGKLRRSLATLNSSAPNDSHPPPPAPGPSVQAGELPANSHPSPPANAAGPRTSHPPPPAPGPSVQAD